MKSTFLSLLFALTVLTSFAQTKTTKPYAASLVATDPSRRFATDAEKAAIATHTTQIAEMSITQGGIATGQSALTTAFGSYTAATNTRLSGIDAQIATLASSTAGGGASVSAVAALQQFQATSTALENEFSLRELWNALYNYSVSPAGKLIAIAGYGDSIGDALLAPIVSALKTVYPVSGSGFPVNGSTFGQLPVSFTGVVPYNLGAFQNQAVSNGIHTGITIARSGATVTATAPSGHGFVVGNYATISGASQSEYNGTFLVTAVSGNTFSFTVSGSPTTPATGSISVYGGLIDYTYLPSGNHTELADGAIMSINGANLTGNATWRTFLAVGPGMGTATMNLYNAVSSSLIATQTVPLTAGALSATMVSFPTSTSLTYRLEIVASGKVVHLQTYALPDNGIVPVTFSRGGSTFTQQQTSSSAILTYLCQQLNVSLVTVTAKEEGLPGSLTGFATRMNSLTMASKLISASAPDIGGTTTADAVLWRNMALANNWTFFDMNKVMAGSLSESQRLGWMQDATHPTGVQNAYMAALVTTKLNLLNLTGTKTRRDVQASNVQAGTISLTNFTDPSQKVDVIVPSGGVVPDQMIGRNFRGIYVRSGTSNIGILGYDNSAIAISNLVGDALAGLRVSTLNTTGTVQVTGDMFATRIRGNSATPTATTNTGAGSGATVTVAGNDVGGRITVVTGTSPVAGGIVARLTFTANSGAPYVTLTANNELTASQATAWRVGNEAGQQFEIINTTGQPLSASSTYVWIYHVIR